MVELAIRNTSRAHAHRSPSDSGRWLNCPGALNLTSSMGERSSSIYAAEGTWAHIIREDCLELGLDPYDFVGHRMFVDGFWFDWKMEDAAFMQPGIDRIRQFEGEMVVEYKVDLGAWMPGDFGTLDCGIIGEKLIVINDLKWGSGELVEAHRNTQQMIYALGFWHNLARHKTDAEEFLLMIDQPRANRRKQQSEDAEFENLDAEDEEETIEAAQPGEFRISLDDLLEFGNEVTRKAKATEDPDAPRIPGKKQCRWCQAAKVEGKCPEYENWNMENLGIRFENLDEADTLGLPVKLPSTLTPQRRSVLIQNWPEIKRWYERMHAHALDDALEGSFAKVPGLKAIPGRRGKRVWSDPSTAEDFLGRRHYVDPETLDVARGKALSADKIFTKRLISPTQAEKLLGKGSLPVALVDRGRPKPVLVSVNDPTPALTSAKIEFDNLDDDEDV